MIEQIAKAYWDGNRHRLVAPWHSVHPAQQEAVRTGVRNAMQAMLQPTNKMLDAARDWSIREYGRGVGNDAAAGCWQAMLRAALEE